MEKKPIVLFLENIISSILQSLVGTPRSANCVEIQEPLPKMDTNTDTTITESAMYRPSTNKTITSEHHIQILLRKVQQFFQEQEFFDTTLIAGADNVTVKAHRLFLSASSDYFLTMFRGLMIGAETGEIELKNVKGSTLKSILDFMYTGTIELSSETIESVLRAAELLQMNTLVAVCCDFMSEQLDPCNCLGIALLAEECGYTELYKKSLAYAYNNFENVCIEEEFLRLNEGHLHKFLSCNELHVASQEILFHSLVAWLKYDEENRKPLISSILLQHVRHAFLEPKFIIQNMKQLCNITECSELMCSWLEWHMSSERPNRLRNKIIFTYRKANDFNLNVQTYNLMSNEWSYEDWPVPSKEKTAYSMFVTNKKMIITGGRINGIATNRVECLDFQSMRWSELPPMAKDRYFHGMAEVNGDLYVVAGENGTTLLRSMEKYDFSTRIWQSMTSLPTSVPFPRLVVLNGLLYVSGECQYHLNCYDPATNNWTQTAEKNEKSSKFSMAAVNEYLYAIGGENDLEKKSRTVERYDPLNNTWTVVKPLRIGRRHICCAVWNDRLFACGGVNDECKRAYIFEEYIPQTNEWKSLPPFLHTDPMNMFSAHLSIL